MDYIKDVSRQFPDIDMTNQAIFGMVASILTDVAWERVIKETYGKEKCDELALKAWDMMGENAYPLFATMLGLPAKLDGIEDAKKIIKGLYRAYLVPMKITQDDENAFNFELLACPYNGYKSYFNVEEGDFICKNWWAVHPGWLYAVLKKAGIGHVVEPSNIKKHSAICCGADTCKLTIKWNKQ